MATTWSSTNATKNPAFPSRLLGLPGGGREGLETPAECALRELEEEFSIRLEEPRIEWQRQYPSTSGSAPFAYFLVARLEDREFEAIRFGDEGQYWRLMEVDAYLAHAMAVPYLQSRLGDYLRERRRIGE